MISLIQIWGWLSMCNEQNIKSNEETESYYKFACDVYKTKYKIKTKVFCKLLFHMLDKIEENATIYLLMQIIQEHRKLEK